MGRINSSNERLETLKWGETFRFFRREISFPLTLGKIRTVFDPELKKYFSLSCLSRHNTENPDMVKAALKIVFKVRYSLEKSLHLSILDAINRDPGSYAALFSSSFFGMSKKQGTSVRMPLITCQPTALCASACYAHDVLDAVPASVVRGVVNGLVASLYEEGDKTSRATILAQLCPHTKRAVRSALKELENLPEEFSRRANIRFSHVGEIIHFPAFANALARQVTEISDGMVDCVLYTRHANASLIDCELFVVNFTLDNKSQERRAWAPSCSRIVFSAFNGKVSSGADVNFLEHHRWSHIPPNGSDGKICPATLPGTKNRTCDAVQCALCFSRPKGTLPNLM